MSVWIRLITTANSYVTILLVVLSAIAMKALNLMLMDLAATVSQRKQFGQWIYDYWNLYGYFILLGVNVTAPGPGGGGGGGSTGRFLDLSLRVML